MNKRVMLSDVFRLAAKYADKKENRHAMCLEIAAASTSLGVASCSVNAVRWLEAMFYKDAIEHGEWRAFWGRNYSDYQDEVRQCRTLTLLFMAEITRGLEVNDESYPPG